MRRFFVIVLTLMLSVVLFISSMSPIALGNTHDVFVDGCSEQGCDHKHSESITPQELLPDDKPDSLSF